MGSSLFAFALFLHKWISASGFQTGRAPFRSHNCLHSSLFLFFFSLATSMLSLVLIFFWARTRKINDLLLIFLSLTPSLHLLPASPYPHVPHLIPMHGVYLAFVETAALLKDSPGINLPCLCQATDQQFTGHQLLGLLGGRLTGILGVWHDRAFTAGVLVPAFKHKENNRNILDTVIPTRSLILLSDVVRFGTRSRFK